MVKYFINTKIPIQYILILILISTFFMSGCNNNPNDLGLNYISSDTLGTLILDSQKDTMNITNKNFLKYVNTSSSFNMMVGNYQNYNSKALLRFNSITADFDSSSILSATLYLRYNGYAFSDSNGITSFNIYKINSDYDFDTVTYDQFSSSDIGTTLLGSYSGTPHDTVKIAIPFNNQTIKDWLESAADTNYTVKNYGIILVPNSNSNNIKAFYTYGSGDVNNIPTIVAIVTKYGVVDTLTFNTTKSVSLNYAPTTLMTNDRIFLQNGVAFRDVMKFDLTKLSSKVIINQALITLSLDRANSFISNSLGSDAKLLANMITDSVALTNDGINFYSIQPDSNTYTINVTPIFQKWNYGVSPNFGILIRNIYDYTNLDKFVFYSGNYSDASKRPKLRIRYTIRR